MSRIIGWYWKGRIYNASTIALLNFFLCVHDEKIFINWFQIDSNHVLVYFCRSSHASLTICSGSKSCILLLLANYWNSFIKFINNFLQLQFLHDVLLIFLIPFILFKSNRVWLEKYKSRISFCFLNYWRNFLFNISQQNYELWIEVRAICEFRF